MAYGTRKETREEGVKARVPFGGHRARLALSDEDSKAFQERGMIPRFINDQDGRIERALEGGYNFVKPEHAGSLGANAMHKGNSDLGSRVSKVVSRGEPVIRAYLMEIKKEYYDEDQRAKEEVNRRVDESLGRGTVGESPKHEYGAGVTYTR